VALKRAVLIYINRHWPAYLKTRLLGTGVFGHGLGAFADGVLGQFAGQQETDGGLNLPAGDGGALVVVGQTAGLGGDAFENIVDEAVHDAHGLGRDAGVGMYLFQHFVDVNTVRLFPLGLALLVGLGDVFLRLAGLLHGLARGFTSWCHSSSGRVRCAGSRYWDRRPVAGGRLIFRAFLTLTFI